ncbi:hypothetical protein C7M61_000675 [Candidozyma pseudohaemuli]|uniref:DNA repair protein REV1 n=1 Tax=Candidozyma pseudohaemuli TaxID=418784 RepID=A0A2P7YYH2_9ASCO|nr:hypothetical protein C7M61_000675 [[Candida] pseudohaemulonii]PSK41006.1 hypothetical protein C7M61_000675 [[Candida] pseudohaemulonii]
MDETYESFLRLLDNSQLLDHIQGLSQGKEKNWSFHGTSTPTARKLGSLRSTESNPFDDDLDDVLLGLKQEDPVMEIAEHTDDDGDAGGGEVGDEGEEEGDDWVPGNQLMNQAEQNGPEEPGEEDNEEGEEPQESMFADVGPLHEFGDFGTYFQNKHLKQQKADDAYIEWERKRRAAAGEPIEGEDIFAGCVVFVNGNTVPSMGVIHKLVILHGGTFLSYLSSKGAATHIVCDRLTPRKRIQFKNYKVVKAQWIADCVKEKKLLNWRDYRLIDDIDYDQQRLGFAVAETSDDKQDEFPDIEEADEEADEVAAEEAALQEEIVAETTAVSPEIPDTTAAEAVEPAMLDPLEGPAQDRPIDLNLAQERSHTSAMDAKHPDFLKHFFANSRLHHLSTWKADLRARFLRMVAKDTLQNNPDATKHTKTELPDDSVVLHIDFDCFFAQASALGHPELDLATDPIAVSHGGKSSDVASCNYVARKLGVSNGMWLGRAKDRCPHLKVIDYDFNAYENYSNSFYNYLLSKKVFDSIFPVLIDEVLVDATSHCRGKDAGFIKSFCEEIRADIYGLVKCTASIGAATNVLLAKLATKRAKPNGFFHLHEDIESYLEGCKVTDLPNVGWSIADKLTNELNLDVHPKQLLIKEIKHLSQQRLSTILGEKIGARVYEMCRGIDKTSITLDLSSSEALLGRKTVSVDVNFGIRFDKFEQAEYFLMQLARELHTRLLALGVCGSVLTLRLARRAPNAPKNPPKFLGLGLCDFFSRSSRMGVPTNDWGILGSEMKALFRVMNIPVEDLRGIAVSLGKLEDIEAVKKQRQQRLEFNRPKAKKPVKPLQSSQLFEYADTVTNSESIDWNVFNTLPDDIRRELKKELLRRGIPVSGKEASPVKKSSTGSPVGKVYLQQLFPTQTNGDFKIARVVESPKKKRKLGISPKKSTSPAKVPRSPTPYNDTVSYDEEVLGEIPTLIREEFFKDLAWQKKNKKLNPVSLRTKLEQKKENLKAIGDSEITSEWVNAQPRALVIEGLGGQQFDLFSILEQVQEWVRLSLEHQGPHPDDIQMFSDFLMSLASQGNISACTRILSTIEKEIELHSTMLGVCSSLQAETIASGISDWRKRYEENLKHGLVNFLSLKNIELRL